MIYHKNIGFPNTLIIPELLVNLIYTKHAKDRQIEDYKLRVVPSVVKIIRSNVIEAHTKDNITLNKMLIRVEYNKTQDMLLVLQILPDNKRAKVITLWVNHKKDQHKTLKKQYDIPCITM